MAKTFLTIKLYNFITALQKGLQKYEKSDVIQNYFIVKTFGFPTKSFPQIFSKKIVYNFSKIRMP